MIHFATLYETHYMLRTTRMHKEIAKEQEASRVKQKTRDMDAEILLYPMILYIMLR